MLVRGGAALLLAAAFGCGDGWKKYDTPGTYGVTAVWSFAPDDVWLGSQIMLHWDGSSFTEVETPPIGFVMDFWGFAPDDLYAVSGNTLLHWDGAAWSAVDFGGAIDPSGLQAVWGTSADDLWLGDSFNSQVHRWNGSQWSTSYTHVVEVTDVWGSSSNDVYVAGLFGLSHWDGSSWTEIDDNDAYRADAVWGFGSDDVWVAGWDLLARWDGETWTNHHPENDEFFENIHVELWGSAPDDLWAVGDFGAVSHWDGSRWKQNLVGSFPYNPYLNAVHGSPAGDVWAVGLSSDGRNKGLAYYRAP